METFLFPFTENSIDNKNLFNCKRWICLLQLIEKYIGFLVRDFVKEYWFSNCWSFFASCSAWNMLFIWWYKSLFKNSGLTEFSWVKSCHIHVFSNSVTITQICLSEENWIYLFWLYGCIDLILWCGLLVLVRDRILVSPTQTHKLLTTQKIVYMECLKRCRKIFFRFLHVAFYNMENIMKLSQWQKNHWHLLKKYKFQTIVTILWVYKKVI